AATQDVDPRPQITRALGGDHAQP
ncbi:MAG: hypothetical protein QOG95_4516, partial [Mycobacterium sp.]|nr:hypothetical protein [Mycobacterium sp.]